MIECRKPKHPTLYDQHKQVNLVQHMHNVVNFELVVEAKETENSEHHLSYLSTSHCPTDTLKQGLTNPSCQVTSKT